ncbi:toll-interacting protein B-like protein [Dinothrombium tinctorium]|uniref:Toll-interacting protein B-like protein n=1 Tax=Dinothrombium tinctorium TaxID=1965070 RepID=A0A443RJY3_9ACAR|nr:toll-interacting protein B-like protein [Dinothrombium tinctorium]
MATTPKRQINEETAGVNHGRRSEVMIGALPDDFLRIDSQSIDEANQIANDEQTALALQQQYFGAIPNNLANNIRGRLDVTVTEAKLTKNYGVTRMDPYLRLRVGHHIYETKTCYNGAKNPKWNKVFHCFLPNGVDSIHIEIYDECAFSADEKIAWCVYTIPQNVFDGETVEDIVPLSGRQGDNKEGSLGLVISFTTLPAGSAMFTAPIAFVNPTTLVVPPTSGVVCTPTTPVYVHPAPQSNHFPSLNSEQANTTDEIEIDEEDVKRIQEMFPSIEPDAIKTILESNRGNKDKTINALLLMTADSQN